MYWPLLNMYLEKILDLGWEVFIIGGTVLNRGKGLIDVGIIFCEIIWYSAA